MNRPILAGPLFLWAALFPGAALGNDFFNRAPGFTVPDGAIAYLGTYASPMSVLGTGSDAPSAPAANPSNSVPVAKSGNFTVGLNPGALITMGDSAAPGISQAIDETNQALVQKASDMGLPLVAVNYNLAYQNALLMHVLNPAKYLYNPKITQFCGNRPYILIGIIDYFDDSPASIKIKEEDNGRKMDYWGKRSVLVKDDNLFAVQGRQHAVAYEFFLVSTKDGNTVWQANTITTRGASSYFNDIAKGLIDNALKHLLNK